jgi:hypothetical protein
MVLLLFWYARQSERISSLNEESTSAVSFELAESEGPDEFEEPEESEEPDEPEELEDREEFWLP